MEYSKLVKLVGENWADFLKPFMVGDGKTCAYDSIAKKLIELYAEDNQTSPKPSKKEVFRAFQEVPLDKLRVILLGIEPFHKPGVANGLAYATDVKENLPPVIPVIHKALEKDAYNGMDLIGTAMRTGELRHTPTSETWMEQGVLPLNMSLTAETGKPGAHWSIWQPFTDFIVSNIWRVKRNIIFIVLGEQAKELVRYTATGADSFGEDGWGRGTGVNIFSAFIVSGEHPNEAVQAKREWVTDVFTKTNLMIRINGLGKPIEW
jgi:uracil DNA glycosylase